MLMIVVGDAALRLWPCPRRHRLTDFWFRGGGTKPNSPTAMEMEMEMEMADLTFQSN